MVNGGYIPYSAILCSRCYCIRISNKYVFMDYQCGVNRDLARWSPPTTKSTILYPYQTIPIHTHPYLSKLIRPRLHPSFILTPITTKYTDLKLTSTRAIDLDELRGTLWSLSPFQMAFPIPMSCLTSTLHLPNMSGLSLTPCTAYHEGTAFSEHAAMRRSSHSIDRGIRTVFQSRKHSKIDSDRQP